MAKTTAVRRLSYDAMFLCAALMLSFLEAVLPLQFLPLPGVKLGLANLAVIACVWVMGLPHGAAVSLARCVIMALLFGNASSFLFSLSGGVGVILILALLRRLPPLLTRLSFVGVSLLTAAAHNLGQLLCAGWMLGWGREIFLSYGGLLLLAGSGCALVTGLLLNLLFRRLRPRLGRLGR